jgi:signal transduction histidine kinase
MDLVLPVTVLGFVSLCFLTAGIGQRLSLERSGIFLFLTSLFTALFYGAYRLGDESLALGSLAKMLGEANYAFLVLFIRAQRKVLPRSSEIRGGQAVLVVSLLHLTCNMTLTGLWQMSVMTLQVLVLIGWVALEAWWLWRSQPHAMRLLLAVLVAGHWLSELIGRSTLLYRVAMGSMALDAPGWTDAMLDWMWVTFFLGFMAQLATAGVVAQALRQDKMRLEQMVSQVEGMLQEKTQMVMKLLASNAAQDAEPQLASLAHELRQPLGAIQLNAEYLASDQRLSREEESQVLQDILRENRRAAAIVQGVRNLFMDKTPLQTAVNLSQLLSHWVTQQMQVLQPTGVQLFLDMQAQTDVWVLGTPVQLEMVLQNLVNNAAEELTAQSAGVIVIKMTTHDRLVMVDVADNGPGLPQALHEKVFEMSYSTKTHGMGLGLWLSRRIAQMHRGDLTCIPCPEGTCMRLALPLELS